MNAMRTTRLAIVAEWLTRLRSEQIRSRRIPSTFLIDGIAGMSLSPAAYFPWTGIDQLLTELPRVPRSSAEDNLQFWCGASVWRTRFRFSRETPIMKPQHKLVLASAVGVAVTFAWVAAGFSDVIVGDRLFPATLTIDDPGVGDELSLPTFSRFAEAHGSIETDLSFEYDKLITPNFALSVSDTWTHVRPGGDGFQNVGLGAKYQLFANAPHEFIVSVGVGADIGGTGAARAGAESFSTITPAVFFGKGFGDLPDNLMGLKPVAVTGEIGLGFPDPWKHTAVAIDTASCAMSMTTWGICGVNVMTDRHPVFLNWGFTFQYSLPYLDAHVGQIEGPAFLSRLIPLVEISLQSPIANSFAGEKTTGTVNPGIVYIADTYQIAVEAMIPINKGSGKHIGVIAQLHFSLDEILPNTLGKPLFRSADVK
jgi:hypothetical protein